MSTVALLLAAGRGERLGRDMPKALVPVAGRPLLWVAVQSLLAVSSIDRIIPVVTLREMDRFREVLAEFDAGARLAEPVAGGAERQDSVRAGLEALPEGTELVAVHDAARPLVRARLVERVIELAKSDGAAILAVPSGDTIKRVEDGWIVETPCRETCWLAQTPQVFRTELLREALAKAAADDFRGTDDAQLVERLGVTVRIVEGDRDNFKLTYPEDLERAERWLKKEGR